MPLHLGLKLMIAGVRLEKTSARVGEELVPDLLALNDGSSPYELAFQWTRDGAPIAGATNARYTVAEADVGAVVGLTVTLPDTSTQTVALRGRVPDPAPPPPPPPADPVLVSLVADVTTPGAMTVSFETDTAGTDATLDIAGPSTASATMTDPVAGANTFAEITGLAAGEYTVTVTQGATSVSASATVIANTDATATVADFSRDMSIWDGDLANSAAAREPDYLAMPSPSDPGAILLTPDTDFNALAWCSLENGGTQVRISGAIPSETIVTHKDLVVQVQSTATGTLTLYQDFRGTNLSGQSNGLIILSGAQIAIGGIRQILSDNSTQVDIGTTIQRDGVVGDVQNVWISNTPSDCLVWNHMAAGQRIYNFHFELGSTLGERIFTRSDISLANVVTGDLVWAQGNGGTQGVYRALVDAPATEPPTTATSTADWQMVLGSNPHQDGVTVPSREVTSDVTQMPRFEKGIITFQRANNTQIGVNNCIRTQDQGLPGNTFGDIALKDVTLESSPNRSIGGNDTGIHAENTFWYMPYVAGRSLTVYADFSIINKNDATQSIRLAPTCEFWGGGKYISHALVHDGVQKTRWPGSPWASGRHGILTRSGTTDAADGASIEMRIVDESGTELYPWAEVDTASGGAWSGSYSGVAPEKVWMRPEVRVAGSAGAAGTTTNRFGIGLAMIEEDQSNTEETVLAVHDELPDGTVTIGNAEGDFQFTTTTPRGQQTKVGAEPLSYIHDGAPYSTVTNHMRALARAAHDAYPGLKIMVGYIVRSGTSGLDLLDDGANAAYAWNEVVENGTDGVIDVLTADGSEIGIFQNNHAEGMETGLNGDDGRTAMIGAVFGTDKNGNVIVPDQTAQFSGTNIPAIDQNRTLNRIFAHAMPGLLTGRTKWCYQGENLVAPPWSTTAQDRSTDFGYPEDTDYIRSRALSLKYVPHGVQQPHTGSDFDIHYAGDVLHGHPLAQAGKMYGWLVNSGLVPHKPARFDKIEWAPDGSYVTIWSTAGDISTQERIENGGAAVNFPSDPAGAPGTPGPTEVYGLLVQDAPGSAWRNANVEIVDEFGNPATAGRLKVTDPNAGTYFRLHYHANYAVNFVRPAGTVAEWVDPDSTAGHVARHFPVIPDRAFPFNPYGGNIVSAPLDPNIFVNSAAEAEAGNASGYLFALSDLAYADFPAGGTFESKTKMSLQVAFNTFSTVGNFRIFDTAQGATPTYVYVDSSDTLIMVVAGGSNVTIYDPATAGDASLYGEDVALLIHYSDNDDEVTVYRDLDGDGTYTLRQTTTISGTATVNFSNNMEFFGSGTGDILLSHVRVWLGSLPTQDANPPTRNVDHGIEMTVGGVITTDDAVADGHALFANYAAPA